MEIFQIRRRHLNLPGCGENSTLARGATVATRSFFDPDSTSNQPVGLGFPHHAGLYRPK